MLSDIEHTEYLPAAARHGYCLGHLVCSLQRYRDGIWAHVEEFDMVATGNAAKVPKEAKAGKQSFPSPITCFVMMNTEKYHAKNEGGDSFARLLQCCVFIGSVYARLSCRALTYYHVPLYNEVAML